jgi:hypothetical protein
MRTGEAALKDGVAFEALDLAAVRGAFGAVKTAAPDALDQQISEAGQTISEMRAP